MTGRELGAVQAFATRPAEKKCFVNVSGTEVRRPFS